MLKLFEDTVKWGQMRLEVSLRLKGEPWERIRTQAQIVNHCRSWKVVTASLVPKSRNASVTFPFGGMLTSHAAVWAMVWVSWWCKSWKYYHQSTYCHVLFPKPRRRSTSSNEVSGCIIVSCIVPCWAHTKSQRRASWCSCWFPLLKQGGRISASKPVADRFHSKFRFLKFLLRLYLLNFASVSSTDDFDSSLTVFTGAGFVASGVALWNIAVVEPLGQGSWT